MRYKHQQKIIKMFLYCKEHNMSALYAIGIMAAIDLTEGPLTKTGGIAVFNNIVGKKCSTGTGNIIFIVPLPFKYKTKLTTYLTLLII